MLNFPFEVVYPLLCHWAEIVQAAMIPKQVKVGDIPQEKGDGLSDNEPYFRVTAIPRPMVSPIPMIVLNRVARTFCSNLEGAER